ncbi:MAG: hypothetical protein HQK86_04935 [Nitrospinae bacterium]|nr:hypothetical protein [Nitrospinota bacterium]MBF0633167.1 hypothetical protein [Nitrospinota bacterium]
MRVKSPHPLSLRGFTAATALCAMLAVGGCSGGGGGGRCGEGTSTEPAVTLVDKVTLGPGQATGPYTVSVPSCSGSLTILADGGDAGDIDISNITDPSGFRMIIEDPNNYPIGLNMAQGPGQSAVSFTLPHGGDYEFKAGTWTFNVTHYDSVDKKPREVSIYTMVKDAPGVTINLNLWIVAIADYQGEGDPNLAVMLGEFRRVMALAGFNVGAVNIVRLEGDQANRLTYININSDDNKNDQSDDLDELFTLSAGAGNDYPNIFLVNYIGGGGVLGIAGGIPGPQIIQGTAHSGVAINMIGGLSVLTHDFLLMQGSTMAHELGHVMGLFHTTESQGKNFDPIADTPMCPVQDFDKNGDGLVSAEECASVDGANLMFWASASFRQDILTPTQRKTISLNPSVK